MTLDSDFDGQLPGQRCAARLQRVWGLAEFIAGNPGNTRKQLAHRFSFSERQIQEDLNVIRERFGLPLVRRSGYRFMAKADEDTFGLADAQVLLGLLARALGQTQPPERVQKMLAALPSIMPLHLRPVVEVAVWAIGNREPMFATLIEALLTQSYVALSYDARDFVGCASAAFRPEAIVPLEGHWYVVGKPKSGTRTQIWPLEPLVAVERAA